MLDIKNEIIPSLTKVGEHRLCEYYVNDWTKNIKKGMAVIDADVSFAIYNGDTMIIESPFDDDTQYIYSERDFFLNTLLVDVEPMLVWFQENFGTIEEIYKEIGFVEMKKFTVEITRTTSVSLVVEAASKEDVKDFNFKTLYESTPKSFDDVIDSVEEM